jgi:signal transduction histidine kinase/CheY-like chemotaxis protein
MTAVPSILVVDDNAIARKMLRLALVTEGYAVTEAADARAALSAAEGALPDLVLQDLVLPDMDGLELLRRLRALPGGVELPIVVLSGFLSRLEGLQTSEDGFSALLLKPIEPSRLIDAIRTFVPQPTSPAPAVGAGRRLLVIDDDPVQLKLTRIHFSQMGFDVDVASGAADALFAARSRRPDVILSDVFMPERDGFDLCLDVRQDPDLAHVPVVLLSAHYASKAEEDLAYRVGANALVLRTPDFRSALGSILNAFETTAVPAPAEHPSDQLALRHARLVIRHLEQQLAATAGLAQRCAIQAGQLSLLSGVANALTHKSDPDVALRDVFAATMDAAGISKGALMLRNEHGVLELRQDIGFADAERLNLQELFGHGRLLEDIVDRGGIVPVPSSTIPERVSRDILSGANVAAAQIVPLISDGCGVGVIIIGTNSADVTSDDSVAFARAMGNQVVQSLELARSIARDIAHRERTERALRRLNHELENEAARIAAAIHDEAGQFLSSAHIRLATLAQALPEEIREDIQQVRHELNIAEEQLRRVSHELHPRMLGDLGLLDAIRFLAETFSRRTGVLVDVDVALAAACPRAIETAFYRLVQEGLTNIGKHAQATRVSVRLLRDEGTLVCCLRDDGIGFDAECARASGDFGLGLTSLRNRLEAIGGELTIISAPRRGTEVCAVVPLPA